MEVLGKVGVKGIAVKLLSKHVYNMSCGLFSEVDFHEVHSRVQQYLTSRSRPPYRLVERTGEWGCYRLSKTAFEVCPQLVLDFSDAGEPSVVSEDSPVPGGSVDLSLDLFADTDV